MERYYNQQTEALPNQIAPGRLVSQTVGVTFRIDSPFLDSPIVRPHSLDGINK